MKVKELIKRLKELPQDKDVYTESYQVWKYVESVSEDVDGDIMIQ